MNDKDGRKPEPEEHIWKYAIFDSEGDPIRTILTQNLSFDRGIQHVLDRNTAEMEPLFKAWMTSTEQDQDVAEQNILDLFERLDVNLLFVPTDGLEKQEMEEVAKKIRGWNIKQHAQKCVFLRNGII